METGLTLDAKLAFLARPDAYPEATAHVTAIETHLSWVFLTDTRAYKLKKPVRYACSDFRRLEARRANCEREVVLNRRLAAEVYLGTVPLIRAANGRLQLGGPGQAVEWLVEMRRLPAQRMLDHLLCDGLVTQPQIGALVVRLVDFYTAAPREDVAPAAYRETLRARVTDNLDALAAPEFAVDRERLKPLRQAQLGFLETQASAIEARASAHRIVEGHGDLRPEHVCLLEPPVVIDCLEFKRALRVIDPLDELGYLALECERLGAPQIGPWILTGYAEASGDAVQPALVHFYQGCRAVLRAKLALWHLRNGDRGTPGRWRASAATYLELARQHADAAIALS
jgi:aminoglycoside phosphotransferase family enzyme